MSEDQITDPAKEIFTLLETMRNFQPNVQEQTHKILRQLFETGDSDADFLNLVSVIVSRFDNLHGLINRAPGLDKQHRMEGRNAVTALKMMFAPDRLVSGWNGNIQAITNNGNLRTIQFLSPQIRQLASYRLPTKEERDEVIRQIDTALMELEDDHDVATTAIRLSLQSLKLILSKLEFFGVEELRNRLQMATANFKVAARTANRRAESWWSSIQKVGGILFKVATIIIAVHDVVPDTIDIIHQADPVVQWVIEETHQYVPPPAPPQLENPDEHPQLLSPDDPIPA